MRLWLFLGVVAAVGVAGCASTPESSDSLEEACVVIDNSDAGGGQDRIFLIGVDTGSREYMGRVGAGRTLRFCTRRSSFPELVRIVIERPAAENIDPAMNQNQARPLWSDQFLLAAWDQWTWDVSLLRLVRVPNGAGGG